MEYRRRIKLIACVVVTLISLVATGMAQEAKSSEGKYSAAGLKENEVDQFFLSFKKAVTNDDKDGVAGMVSYPIDVSLASGKRITIRNKVKFIQLYKSIFDTTFKQRIEQTQTKDLWANWQGVAMPRGEIWINGIVKDDKKPENYIIKITTINNVIARGKNGVKGK